MINLFNFASNDQALVYLTQIFGSMNGIIPTPSGSTNTSGGSISLLGTMFQTFNGVILTVGALVVVYTTVVGVLMTAHEGEFMGKKWSNLWIPIRTVLGIACLVPTGSGYSGVQLIMMWVIVQGIGAADSLWNTALIYIDVAGSPYAAVSIPSVQVNQSLGSMFQSIVCDTTAKIVAANPIVPPGLSEKIAAPGGYYCNANPKKSFCTSSISFPDSSGTTKLGPEGVCGTFTYCNPTSVCASKGQNSIACKACIGQQTALKGIIPTLQGIAQVFVANDLAYSQAYHDTQTKMPQWVQAYCAATHAAACTPQYLPDPKSSDTNPPNAVVSSLYWPYGMQPQLGPGDFLNTVTSFYLNAVTGEVNSFIQQQAQQNPSLSNSKLKDAQAYGWMFAGAYFYTLSQMNGNNLTEAVPSLSTTPFETNPSNNVLSAYRNNNAAAQTLINAAAASQGSAGGGGGGGPPPSPISSAVPALSGLGSALQSSMQNTKSTFTSAVSTGYSGTNPLAGLVAFGQALLAIAEALFAVFLIVTAVATGLGYFDAFVLGTGVDNPIGPTVTTIYMFVVPAFLALQGALISMGASLAIYLPLVPYIIFLFGAISWLLSTIETMVAGPLVALGILSPSGQHELLGKSEPALMLLFYVFLRPSLMIFGLMAALLLSVIVISMINSTFGIVLLQITSFDPIELILFLVAYVFLLITALNKCYEAIYIIPQRVMDWIGGHAREGGEGAAAGEVKGGISAGAGGAAGAAQFAGGAAKSGAESSRKFGKEQAAAQEGLTLTGQARTKVPPPKK